MAPGNKLPYENWNCFPHISEGGRDNLHSRKGIELRPLMSAAASLSLKVIRRARHWTPSGHCVWDMLASPDSLGDHKQDTGQELKDMGICSTENVSG